MLYWIIRPLAVLFYKIFYPVKIFGKENRIKKGKSIVTCNHLGKADVLVVGALFPNKTAFLAKKEWWDKKLFGKLISSLGAIPLDRDKPSLSTIKSALGVLKANKRLAIFPEGRRNFETNDLQQIKQGATFFAIKGQATITPIIIYDRLKFFKKNYAIVGKPLDFSKYYGVKYDEISSECAEILANEMKRLQQELFEKVDEIKSKKGKK